MTSNSSTGVIVNGWHCRDAESPDHDAAPMPKLRVALLTNEVPPYRVPKYCELAATPGWDFKVFTCIKRERQRMWDVPDELPFAARQSFSLSYVRRVRHQGRHAFEDERQVHLPIGLAWDLWRFDPQVIISSEFGVRTLIAATYAKLRRRTLVVRSEFTSHTEREPSGAQRFLRHVLRGVPSAHLVNGQQGRMYLEQLGVAPAAIFEIGQAIDTQSFAVSIPAAERAELRAKLNVRGHCYLHCGMMVPRKGLDKLMSAWIDFSKSVPDDVTLLLLGDGPERSHLERRVQQAQLQNVRFLNHLQRTEVPAIYHCADVFVLPSLEDCWALVVEEAFAAGLPVICSIYNGGSERIREGANGWLVDPLNHVELVNKLKMAYDSRGNRAAMSAAARTLSADMSISAVAQRIRQAVNAVRPPHRGIANTSGTQSAVADFPANGEVDLQPKRRFPR